MKAFLLSRLLVCTIGAGLVVAPLDAHAETYPSKPIKFIVSFAAGGFVDTVSRLVGQKLSQQLGQPVVVENRPGAAGNIAHRVVARSEADGYTILATSTALAINESLYSNRGYAGGDFSAVAIVASSPEVLVAPASGATSLNEIVQKSRQTSVNFGTAGAGSASYIVTEYFFKALAKGQGTHVPFQGGAPLLNTVLGNHIELAAAAMAGGFVQHIQSGALRGLAIASETRVPIVPNVPTYIELGYPDFSALSWAGFFVPAKTPSDVVNKLNQQISGIMKDPEIVAKLIPGGFLPMYNSVKEADSFFHNDIEKWSRMIRAIDLRVE
jgi:tripartite-type tricarboxylate transporter receptor subunit TctC